MDCSKLQLVRGDTRNLVLNPAIDGEIVDFDPATDGGILSFSMENLSDSSMRMTVTTTLPNNVIRLKASDTENLEPGRYKFDFEYRRSDKSLVKTLVIGTLKLIGDVTR